MSQEYKRYDDSTAKQITAFVKHYADTKQRVSDLTMFANKASKEGGVFALSRDAIEDNLAVVHVGPDVLLPRLLEELEAQKMLAAKLERKAKQIIDILNS